MHKVLVTCVASEILLVPSHLWSTVGDISGGSRICPLADGIARGPSENPATFAWVPPLTLLPSKSASEADDLQLSQEKLAQAVFLLQMRTTRQILQRKTPSLCL